MHSRTGAPFLQNTDSENSGEAANEMSITNTDNDSGGVNVNGLERWASAIGGGALVTYGLMRRGAVGYGLAALGASLLHRGATGHCYAYNALGVNTAGEDNGGFTSGSNGLNIERGRDGLLHNPNATIKHGEGIRVEKSVTVNKSAFDLYAFWRNFENLPTFMNHLESVTVQSDTRSHWVAKAPAGRTVEWDAQVINEEPGKLIAWRSLEGADVPNSGSVRFVELPGGRGTEVRVELEYKPPAGKIGMAVAKLFGEEPNQQVDEDLRRFKSVMEAGEIPTTEGQPSGRKEKAKD